MRRALLVVPLCVLVACGGQRSAPPGGGTPRPTSKRIAVKLTTNSVSGGQPCVLETQEPIVKAAAGTSVDWTLTDECRQGSPSLQVYFTEGNDQVCERGWTATHCTLLATLPSQSRHPYSTCDPSAYCEDPEIQIEP